MLELYKDTIKLFKVVVVEDPTLEKENPEILESTIRRGFVFTPNVIANAPKHFLQTMIDDLGISPEQLNAGFHKSFEKVQSVSLIQLYIEQLLHYFSTYGAEALGVYDQELVYVPAEKLSIPEISGDIPLVVIRGISKEEFRKKLLDFLSVSHALSEDVLESVRNVLPSMEFSESDLQLIKNREVRIYFYEWLNIIPKDPIEFLRLLVYTATNSTLLIKSNEVLTQIRAQDNFKIAKLVGSYQRLYGLEQLASIFFRFKPIFLAFRTNPYLKKTINKLRRLAPKFHKPYEGDYLSQVTVKLRSGTLSLEQLKRNLATATPFQKIRLYTALCFYSEVSPYASYRIRNGKVFVADASPLPSTSQLLEALNLVEESIVKILKPKVEGKVFYIPSFIEYALPTSEKQYLGNIPYGTRISFALRVPALTGVHWFNTAPAEARWVNKHSKRVDLDLSFVNFNTKIGWDGSYREAGVYFSGDMTSAPRPKGAVEVLWYDPRVYKDCLLLTLNYFNCEDESDIVPFKFILSQAPSASSPMSRARDYLINPNNVLMTCDSKIGQREIVLGVLYSEQSQAKFIFAPGLFVPAITSRPGELTGKLLTASLNYTKATPLLQDFLVRAGAKVTTDTSSLEEEIEYVDFSPAAISKESFISLVS